ncbi:MAG: UDP-N-acetylmuramate dehydrogenase [Acidobacteria bacterium]|nr:UDP-N-acetylmuramate dehydrogenase [Acidobacteriota bacterium]
MRSNALKEEMAGRVGAAAALWLPGELMARHTSLGIGGPADVIEIRDAFCLPELVAILREYGIPWRIMGGGTNLLVADEGLEGVVLHLARTWKALEFQSNRVEVPASQNLGTAVMECAKRNLGGMEGLIGVPGSVGGALRMNAGAYGTQIGDAVRSLTVFRGAVGRVETLQTSEMRFEYRHTSFAPDDIMLSALLELPERPYTDILERVKQCNQRRRASQPVNEKSAGCIFKNPPGYSAGKLIDELGLKGTRVGGAVVSERHANFVVNRFQASASDILKLIELIRERVLRACGVELEEEVIIWRDIAKLQ